MFGGKFWNLEGNCDILNTKSGKMCLNWRLACREINIVSSCALGACTGSFTHKVKVYGQMGLQVIGHHQSI